MKSISKGKIKTGTIRDRKNKNNQGFVKTHEMEPLGFITATY